MESKETKNLEDTQDAGSTNVAGTGDERGGPGRLMGSLDAKVPSAFVSSNSPKLGSSDAQKVKVAAETGSAACADGKTAVAPDLSSSSHWQDMELYATDLSSSSHWQDMELYAQSMVRSAFYEHIEKVPSHKLEGSREIGPANPKAWVAPDSAISEDSAMPPACSSPTETEHMMPNEEDWVISTSMRPELYRAATSGDIDAFEVLVGGDAESRLIGGVTPRRNSVLHLAAGFGHHRIVNFILRKCPDLVEHKNHNDDLALHVAASAGHLTVVKSLVSFARNSACREGPKTVGANLLRKVNRQGNTALHLALENGQLETAIFLVQAEPIVSYCSNGEGKTPLHMATKSGYLEIVKHVTTEYPSRLNSYKEGKSIELKAGSAKPNYLKRKEHKVSGHHNLKGCQLLHASIIGRNKDVMDRISGIDSSLVYSTDEEGRIPLSLAASIGFVDGVCYILDESTETAYMRDRSGFFPIHWACMKGHIEIIDAFLSRCPDSVELLNKQGENLLHVAAKNGRAKLVSWMLKASKLDMLINEKDDKGFTPLHWATFNFHPKVVSILTWDKRVNLEITNSEGLTALDIAEKKIDSDVPFRKRLTWTALKSANAPRSEEANKRREMVVVTAESFCKSPDLERVNTLLLVATLVATVTYACGFTLPGGNNDSGMATMVTKLAFQAFLICNTIAMYCSIVVAVTLIWAQLGDLNLVKNSLRIALPLLGVALTAMSSAFICGVYLVVNNQHWLAILVLTAGSIFTLITCVIFFSLAFPLSSTHWVVRCLMYYPIELMILASESDVEKVIKV